VEFVHIKHPKIEKSGTCPITALPHWESYGWERIDPPKVERAPRTAPARRVRAPRPVPKTSAPPRAAKPAEPAAPTTKAPRRSNKED
jgi:hypothetical protein